MIYQKLSIIVPVYNEVDSIEKVFERIEAEQANLGGDTFWKIFAVNF